ncbi:MAG: tripartite tricarboxylate transporter TctB family protein [Candidatus Bathyarchaeia archaeon]
MDFDRDILSPLILIGIATIYLTQILLLPPPFATEEPGPALYPLMIVFVIYASSFRILLKGLKGGGKLALSMKGVMRPIAFLILSALYIPMLTSLGYFLSTALYTLTIALMFDYGRRRVDKSLVYCSIVAVLVTIIGYILFEILFGVSLPRWEI